MRHACAAGDRQTVCGREGRAGLISGEAVWDWPIGVFSADVAGFGVDVLLRGEFRCVRRDYSKQAYIHTVTPTC